MNPEIRHSFNNCFRVIGSVLFLLPKVGPNEESFNLSSEIFRGPRNSSLLMTYQKFVADVAVAFGANASEAEVDVENMLDLQIQLAGVSYKVLYQRE